MLTLFPESPIGSDVSSGYRHPISDLGRPDRFPYLPHHKSSQEEMRGNLGRVCIGQLLTLCDLSVLLSWRKLGHVHSPACFSPPSPAAGVWFRRTAKPVCIRIYLIAVIHFYGVGDAPGMRISQIGLMKRKALLVIKRRRM